MPSRDDLNAIFATLYRLETQRNCSIHEIKLELFGLLSGLVLPPDVSKMDLIAAIWPQYLDYRRALDRTAEKARQSVIDKPR